MVARKIPGGEGTGIHVESHGPDDSPSVLFIHGFSQSRLCWIEQLTSDLAEHCHLVAMDLRGHGRSEKPPSAKCYTRGEVWAADVAAVLTQLRLTQPILVGWSYGGLAVCDYLRHYGTDAVAGLVFVCAATRIGTEAAQRHLTRRFCDLIPDLTSGNNEACVAALVEFVELCFDQRLDDRDFYRTLGYNVMVPPFVRAALLDRVIENHDLLCHLDVPVLIVHGQRDRICSAAESVELARNIAGSRLLLYEDVGHSLFFEAAERFNEDLLKFVRACSRRGPDRFPDP